MAKNPDPSLALATSAGVTRTVDDWSTMFRLCLLVLPGRSEAAAWIPVGRRIFATLGDADCKCAFVVAGSDEIARRLLGPVERDVMTFVDPDLALVSSLGLERLPALVFLRQDTSLVAAAEGWDPTEWQRVVRQVAKAMAWTVPIVQGTGDPAKTEGWPIVPA